MEVRWQDAMFHREVRAGRRVPSSLCHAQPSDDARLSPDARSRRRPAATGSSCNYALLPTVSASPGQPHRGCNHSLARIGACPGLAGVSRFAALPDRALSVGFHASQVGSSSHKRFPLPCPRTRIREIGTNRSRCRPIHPKHLLTS